VQRLCALAGLVLGLLLPRITSDSTVAGTRVTEALVAVGFGVLGLVTVIFSLLFLVVQWASSSLSPRLTLSVMTRSCGGRPPLPSGVPCSPGMMRSALPVGLARQLISHP
jgi:hypothetical protein